jgi:hypothetical protein
MIPKYKIGDLVVLKSNSPRIKIVDDKLGIDINNFNYFNGLYECLFTVCGRNGRFVFPGRY